MGLFNLFTRTTAKIGSLELDASVTETHKLAAEVTQHEVEDGSKLNDHVIVKAKSLTIFGVVTKTPLGASALIASALTTGANQLVGPRATSSRAATAARVGLASVGGIVASAIGPDGLVSREPEDVFKYLEELCDARVPFDVVTGLKTYTSMVLTSVEAIRTAQVNGALPFTATMEQVRIVASVTVDLPVGAAPAAANATANLGKQAAGAASAKSGDNASLLFQAARAAGAPGVH